MTTKKEMIEIIKAENPTLQVGDEENGYTQLTGADYDAIISEWADARLLKEAQLAEAEAKAAEKQAILDRLGLSADEAKLLLG